MSSLSQLGPKTSLVNIHHLLSELSHLYSTQIQAQTSPVCVDQQSIGAGYELTELLMSLCKIITGILTSSIQSLVCSRGEKEEHHKELNSS